VNITSQVTAIINGVEFLEALLIIDEPNSPSNPSRALLNCGQTNAPDSTSAGPGVCAITGDGFHGGGSAGATATYDGSPGHPNVFQARSFRLLGIGAAANQMVFSGVPIDPPGTVCPNQSSQPVCHRILRITNIRGDAASSGLINANNTTPITASLNANPFAGLPVDSQSRPIATVEVGLNGNLSSGPKLDFIQCTALESQTQNLVYTFQENFNNAFKPQSLTQTLNNGQAKPSYNYTNGLTPNTQQGVLINQNVPGAVYDSESGFVNKFAATQGDNPLNPLTGPAGGSSAGAPFTNVGCTVPVGLGNSCTTGIAGAGIATQGTRLALTFSSLQLGTKVSLPIVVNLQNVIGSGVTGVAVLIANPLPSASGFGGGPGGPGGTLIGNATVAVGGPTPAVAVYEVFFANPNALEKLAVTLFVSSGTPNLSINQPTPGAPSSQIQGSFAPYYNPPVGGDHEAAFPSGAEIAGTPGVTVGFLPIPRFIQTLVAQTFFQINRCSCNLLFPYVTNAVGFDTSIAIANTSLDPGSANGFFGTPQSGPVQLWFYSRNPTGLTPPLGTTGVEPNFGFTQLNSQCTNANSTPPGSCTEPTTKVPPGGYMVYTLFNGGAIPGGATGSVLQSTAAAGATGFTGYIIAQARFQYCHGFAYISKQNAPFTDPTNTSMGYLAIVLDRPAGTITGTISGSALTGTITLGLPRTASSPGENDAH